MVIDLALGCFFFSVLANHPPSPFSRVPFNRIRLVATRRKMLKLCGDTEEKLAQELLQFEFQIERDVVEPLCVIAEVRPLPFTDTSRSFHSSGPTS